MRLDINLATQPYEDAREFWVRWGTALGAAGLLTLVLLGWTIAGWFNARRDRIKIAEFQAQIAQRDRTRQQAEDFMNRPENRAIRDQSRLINGLIDRKAFSWTRVLESLEKVMPPRVHLVSMHPQLSEDNLLTLKMSVAGDSRDRAIELARRMEETRRFAQTSIEGETHQVNATDNIQLDIFAIYIPGTDLPEPQPPTDKPAKSTKSATTAKSIKTPKPSKLAPKFMAQPTARRKP